MNINRSAGLLRRSLTLPVFLTAGLNAFAAPPLTEPVDATIVNTDKSPVPVLPVTPPWSGTPKVETAIFPSRPGGFENCEVIYTAEFGKVFIVNTVSARFNSEPGKGGGMRLEVTLPDGSTPGRIVIPVNLSAPARQVNGFYDGYAGSLNLGGLPIIAARACLSGDDAAGTQNLIGFEFDLPEAP
jgi:hypothetical protein